MFEAPESSHGRTAGVVDAGGSGALGWLRVVDERRSKIVFKYLNVDLAISRRLATPPPPHLAYLLWTLHFCQMVCTVGVRFLHLLHIDAAEGALVEDNLDIDAVSALTCFSMAARATSVAVATAAEAEGSEVIPMVAGWIAAILRS